MCCHVVALNQHGDVSMKLIIMFVYLLSGHWVEYSYQLDPQMAQVKTLDDCGREAELLKMRRGDVTSWLCYQSGESGHLILPPYKWPNVIEAEKCDMACLLEESDARIRRRTN